MVLKKKLGQIIIFTVFICCVCLPNIIWFFVRGYLETENNENRSMALKPSFSIDEYPFWANDYEQYYNDNMPFRDLLISVNRKISYFIFHESLSEKVILGDDGWLFFSDTINDYQRNNLYDDFELEKIKNDVLKTKAYFDEKGIQFIIFIGPNKASVYGDYMPSKYEVFDSISRTEQVVAYLKEKTDVTVFYPKDELLRARDENPLKNMYLRLDTHWNYLGGYFATKPLLEYLGISMADLSEVSCSEVNEPDFIWNGYDLANMLGLADVLDSDTNYQLNGYTKNEVIFYGDARNDIDVFNGIMVASSNSSDNRKLFFARDSFGEAMSPYLAAAFRYMYSPHRWCLTKTMIEKENPDIFIYEMVERNGWDGINVDDWVD